MAAVKDQIFERISVVINSNCNGLAEFINWTSAGAETARSKEGSFSIASQMAFLAIVDSELNSVAIACSVHLNSIPGIASERVSA